MTKQHNVATLETRWQTTRTNIVIVAQIFQGKIIDPK